MLGLFCLLSFIPSVISTGCLSNTIGAASPDGATYDQLENNTDSGYLAKSYKLTCCGLLSKFNVYLGATGIIHLQVWRKQSSGSTYDLVLSIEKNFDTVDQINRVQEITLDAPLRTVKVDDVIGWYTTGTDMVPYKTGTGDNMRISPGMTSGSAFSTGSTLSQRDYAINLVAIPNNNPKFTNLPFSKCDYLDTDYLRFRTLYTVEFTDDDVDDVTTATFTTMLTPKFIFDLQHRVKVQQNYVDVGIYQLEYTVKDTCNNTATSYLTMCINNTAPKITNTQTSFTIREDDNTGGTVFTLTVTDKQGYTCNHTANPFDNIFEITDPTGTPTLTLLQGKAHPKKMNYDRTAQYSVLTVCTDTLGLSSNKTFTIDVIRNNECAYTGLPTTVEVSTRTKNIGEEAYQVVCTDPEGDGLTYTMSCQPNCVPFEIEPTTGKITVKTDLNTIPDQSLNDYTVTLTTNDGHRDSVETVYLKLTDFNTKPTITNPSTIKTTVQVLENTAFEYAIAVYDSDELDTHTFEYIFIRPSCKRIYATDISTGKITTIKNLDYEDVYKNDNELMSCDVIVTVDDSRDKSDHVRIILEVTDVNEPQNGFTNTECAITADEGKTDKVLEDLGLIIDEPDLNDVQHYTMDCGTRQRYFKMDSSTSVISQRKEFDLDADVLESAIATCDVTATDKGGHKTTITCTITVEESNDNPPILDKDKYEFTVTEDTTVGTTLGTCTSTDIDVKAAHKEALYSARSGVVIISDPCTIKLATSLTGRSNTIVLDTLVATDKDPTTNGQLTATATVCIIVIPPTTTPIPVTTQMNTNNNNNNNGGTGNTGDSGSPADIFQKPATLAWFIPAMIALAALLGLMAYMIYRCCRVPGFCSRLFSDMCGCFNNRDCCGNRGSGRITKVKQANPAESRQNNAVSEKSEPRGKGNKVDKVKPIHVAEKPNMPADNTWNIWTHKDLTTNTYLK